MNFSELVDAAILRANMVADPFVPSRKQYEDELVQVVEVLKQHNDPWAYIKKSHRGAGTFDAVACKMFKQSTRQAD